MRLSVLNTGPFHVACEYDFVVQCFWDSNDTERSVIYIYTLLTTMDHINMLVSILCSDWPFSLIELR